MADDSFQQALSSWRLPEGDDLLEQLELMVRPTLLGGHFGDGLVPVGGLQYHLGGKQDTAELAELARIGPEDRVLDVCCFAGGSALQLVTTYGCEVTGVDISDKWIVAANRLAEIAGLSDRATFHVADAAQLPFDYGEFTVVWSQCSIEHSEAWLKEFDRVLRPGGRLALTFEIKKHQADPDFPRCTWSLEQIADILAGMGYTIEHADDITLRDVEIGWKALDRKLLSEREVYAAAFGDEWVERTHRGFLEDMENMAAGRPANGRLVASKVRV